MTGPANQTVRLCIVAPNHSSLPGGSEYQIGCLLEILLATRRYEIHYLTSTLPEAPQTDSYRIVRIGSGNGAPRFGYLAHAVPLYRALRALLPSVIYQRVGCGYTGIAAYYALRHDAKLVWHVASDTDVTPERSLEGRNPARRFLEKRSVEYGIRRANCIVTQTAQQARMLELHYRRRADAIIPNFHPQPCEPIDKSGPLTVVWVASLKPFKQPEVFARLAQTWRDRADVRFVLVGPASAGPRYAQWTQALLEHMRAIPHLSYLGACSQDEVNQLLARSHIFVSTSLYEGFPNTFIQAWMRETAVVSLHVDPDDLLAKGGVGIFCGGSEQRLFDAVRSLVEDPALRARYTDAALEYASARHSLANAHDLARLLAAGGTMQ